MSSSVQAGNAAIWNQAMNATKPKEPSIEDLLTQLTLRFGSVVIRQVDDIGNDSPLALREFYEVRCGGRATYGSYLYAALMDRMQIDANDVATALVGQDGEQRAP